MYLPINALYMALSITEGKFILEPIYYNITPSIGQIKLYTVQTTKYQCGIINSEGVEIIPFGKYSWIDGFDHGLSRVKSRGK